MTTDTSLHSRALSIITPSLIDWAEKKNVFIADEFIELAARYVLGRISEHVIAPLLAFDHAALIEMRRAIFYALDVCALMQIYHCYAQLEGGEIDPELTHALCEKHVTAGYALAADTLDPIIWGDPMDMAMTRRAQATREAGQALREASDV